ncbi:helix-turn-helix domain-containing protein [Lentzea aerocolonigenes]|uniref:helix-turn-helix domain-containing protein n=1 Tax=Lentzea aerocolonigenes TaxID=68170 RepID=UPI0004C35502|nr:helix-turn-helix transcriptional regulator [Lentzea aerocolonigenes]MCP2242542.1 regulatory protein, luxR family [Lentzea aerocolonigenes]
MLLRTNAQQARCPAALAIRQTIGGTDFPEAARLAHAALDAPACRDDPVCLWRALIVLIAAGDLVTADAHADRLPDHAVRAQVRSQIARLSGDLGAARDLLANAPPAVKSSQLLSVALLVEVLVDSGDVDEAEKTLLANELDHALRRPSSLRPALLAARAAVNRARGRPLAAYVDHLVCGDDLLAMGVTSPAIAPWRGKAALAAHDAHREELARRLAVEELAAARRWGEPRTVGTALSTLGRVGGDDGTTLLSDAADLLAVAGARHELAAIRLELGHRLAARGDDSAARGEYASARTAAARTGDERHLRQASEALARLPPVAVRALTRQEDLVASLAEAGLSNRAIAQRLFLTVSTVEVHLSNVYRKLGVNGRKDLAGALR